MFNNRKQNLILIIILIICLLIGGIFLYKQKKVSQLANNIKSTAINVNNNETITEENAAHNINQQEVQPKTYTNPYFNKEMFDHQIGGLTDVMSILMVKDSDGDGLPDEAENVLSRDPQKKDFQISGFDTDADKLINEEEKKNGTDPEKQDTDDDNLSDWAEIMIYQTDPLNNDTNQNGIIDSEEQFVLEIQEKIKNNSDSDRDGLTYSEEKEKGTDLEKRDSDGDGLLDGAEVIFGKNPLVKDNDIEAKDSDGDGLSDAEEEKFGANPNQRDSDGDGLLDYQEVIIYQTNPLLDDTDGDGYNDFQEIQNDFNPNGEGVLPKLPSHNIKSTS